MGKLPKTTVEGFLFSLSLGFLFSPFVIPSAQANMGIPTLMLMSPYMLITLLPVIGIELFIIASAFGINHPKITRSVIQANVLTTILGYPIFYVLSFILAEISNFFIFPSFFIIADGMETFEIVFPNMIIAFILSLLVEYHFLSWYLKISHRKLFPAVFAAHVLSYVFLTGVAYMVLSSPSF